MLHAEIVVETVAVVSVVVVQIVLQLLVEIEPHVHPEIVLVVETVPHAQSAIGHRVHRAQLVIVQSEIAQSEIVHKVSAVHVQLVETEVLVLRAIDHSVHHVSHDLSRQHRQVARAQLQRLLLPRPQRRRQRLKQGPLRASRGERKPCYWHHHVQNIVDNIVDA
jgi:hypothetical protein